MLLFPLPAIIYALTDKRRRASAAILCVIFYAAGNIYAAKIVAYKDAQVEDFLRTPVTMTGEVTWFDDTHFALKLYKVDADGTVYTPDTTAHIAYRAEKYQFELREIIQVQGRLYSFKQDEYNGDYNLKLARFSQGSYIAGSITDKTLIKLGKRSVFADLMDLSYKTREYICNVIDKHLSEDHAAVIKAICLGYKAGMSPSVRETLSKSGISHITVASGLHLSVLLLALQPLLYRKQRSTIFAAAATMLVIAAFCLLTMFSPSILRASIMCSAGLIAFATNRRYNAISALFLSSLFMLLYNPFYLYNLSFQMSFASTLSILIFYPLLRDAFQAKKIARAICFTAAATIGVMPIVAYTMNYVSFAGIVVNLIAGYEVLYLLCGGYLLLVFGAVPVVGDILVSALALLLDILLFTADVFANKLPLWLSIPSPRIGLLAIYFIAVFLLYILLNRRIAKQL